MPRVQKVKAVYQSDLAGEYLDTAEPRAQQQQFALMNHTVNPEAVRLDDNEKLAVQLFKAILPPRAIYTLPTDLFEAWKAFNVADVPRPVGILASLGQHALAIRM